MAWRRTSVPVPPPAGDAVPTCSRTSKTGKPCRRQIFSWRDDWDRTGLTLPDPASCIAHLTQAERADLEAARARHRRAVNEHRSGLIPACWRWPVPVDPLADARVAALADADALGYHAVYSEESAASDALTIWHADRCAVCEISRVPLVDDHDHITGLVRGRLCHSCNTREGVGDDPVFDLYRRLPPAAILGVQVRYYSPVTGYARPEPTQGDTVSS